MTGKKIGEGQRFDVNQVSKEGISKEEMEAAKKKNLRLMNIFNAFDLDKSGNLDSKELALAMDSFKAFDEDGNSRLTDNEFLKMAEGFRDEYGENFLAKDFKEFLNVLRKTTRKDEKVAAQPLVNEYYEEVAHSIKMESVDRQAKELGLAKVEGHEGVYYDTKQEMYLKLFEHDNKMSLSPAKYDEAANKFEYMTDEEYTAVMEAKAKAEADAKAAAEAEAKAEAEARAKAEAEAREKAKPQHTYVVQSGDSFTEVIKKSLQAQGVENPTKEQIAQEKEKFKKYNPDAVKTAKNGVEYLLAGDEVKLHGKVDYAKSSEEAQAQWAEEKRQKDVKTASSTIDKTSIEEGVERSVENRRESAEWHAPLEAPAVDVDWSKYQNNGFLDMAAQKAGYEKTECPAYYQDQDGQYYKWNLLTNSFEPMEADAVYPDGSYERDIKDPAANNQLMVRDVYDFDNNLIKRYQVNDDGTIYEYENGNAFDETKLKDKDGNLIHDYTPEIKAREHAEALAKGDSEAIAQEAQNLGYRKTDHSGTYYDEETKTYYRWDNAEQKFVKLDADLVRSDGTYIKDGIHYLNDGTYIKDNVQYYKDGTYQKGTDLYSATGQNLTQAASDLAPRSDLKSSDGKKLSIEEKEAMTANNHELLDKIAAGDNIDFNAQVLISSSSGFGSNRVIFKAVMNAANDVSYFEKLDEKLKEAGTSIRDLIHDEYFGQRSYIFQDNKYYKEFLEKTSN